jgi:hypothetical protein
VRLLVALRPSLIDPAIRNLRLLGEERSPGIPSCARIFTHSLFGAPVIVASKLREEMALRIDKQIIKRLKRSSRPEPGKQAECSRPNCATLPATDSKEVEKAAMIIRAYGHASTETLVATPWKEFLAAL